MPVKEGVHEMDRLNMHFASSKKNILLAIGIFLGMFFVLFVLIGKVSFVDEIDNFVGGMLVAAGDDVYAIHTSQHMPFMYYLCAIFRALGASSVYTYRIAYDVFMALLWTVMYFRYRSHFGKIVMLAYPIIYVFLISSTSMGTCVLADQMQAHGMVILMIEFFLFLKQGRIGISNAGWISLAVVFSFGSTFVAAYGVFVILLGVFLVYAYDRLAKQSILANGGNGFWKQLGVTTLIVLAPFALLMLWYLVSGNLSNFVEGAYKVNAEIYSKYMGGFGSNPLQSAIERVSVYANCFVGAVQTIMTAPLDSAIVIICYLINFAFVICIIKQNWVCAAVTVLYIFANGMRGFVGFHALSYYGITAFMFAWLLEKALDRWKWRKWRISFIGLACLLCVVAIPYASACKSIVHIPARLFEKHHDPLAMAVQQIVDEDERIHITTLNIETYLNANRLPMLSAPSSVPWMYEAYGEKEIQMLEETKPKVIVFSPEWSVWGYHIKEYAPELVDYIWANYSLTGDPSYDTLYVRNDLVEEAKELFDVYPISIAAQEAENHLGKLQSGSVIAQTFVANDTDMYGLSVFTATYAYNNATDIMVQIIDIGTGEVLNQAMFNTEEVYDNFYSSVMLPCQTHVGRMYELRFTLENTLPFRQMTFYRTADNTATEESYALINGVPQSYNLCFNIFADSPSE